MAMSDCVCRRGSHLEHQRRVCISSLHCRLLLPLLLMSGFKLSCALMMPHRLPLTRLTLHLSLHRPCGALSAASYRPRTGSPFCHIILLTAAVFSLDWTDELAHVVSRRAPQPDSLPLALSTAPTLLDHFLTGSIHQLSMHHTRRQQQPSVASKFYLTFDSI